MPSRIIKIALFFILLIVGDRMLAGALDRLVLSSQFRYSRLYQGDCEADVIVVGNSRGVAGFYAPEIEDRFGVKCLNLSYNGMSSAMVSAVLHDYLERNAPPKLVIVEATCVDSEFGNILSLKPYWKHSERLRSIAQTDQPKAMNATRVSSLFSYNCELFLRVLFFRSKSDQTWIRRTSIDDDLLAQTTSMEPFDLQLPTDEELADIDSIVALCKSTGVDCQVVVAPYLLEYRDKMQNWESWLKKMQDAVSASGGGEIVDLSGSIQDPQYFGDRLHVNFASRAVVIDAAEAQGVYRSIK